MKHRIAEAQLRKLVYSQVKRLTEALPLPSGVGSSARNKAVDVDEEEPQKPSPELQQKLTQVLGILKKISPSAGSNLANAFSDVKKLQDPELLKKALSTADNAALAQAFLSIITPGGQNISDFTNLMQKFREINALAVKEAKAKKQQSEEQTVVK